MKVIEPVRITEANFISSTVGEPAADEAAWSGGATYALGARVIIPTLHKLYESLQAGNTGHYPPGAPDWWVEVSADNRWAMFDQVIGTRSTVASPLTVAVAPGRVNALALLELVGTAAIVTMTVDGETVYSAEASLDGTLIDDWYGYWFAPYEQREAVIFTDLPAYTNGVVTVTITGDDVVGCGVMVVGNAYDIGLLEAGATAGITDYSQKQTNEFGITQPVERAFAKRMEGQLLLENGSVNSIYKLLTSLRATPAVYIGSDDTRFEQPLVIYGFYRDFRINIALPEHSYCTIEIEGLV